MQLESVSLNKLTEKEAKQIREMLEIECGRIRCDSSASFSYGLILDWVSEKKKEWIHLLDTSRMPITEKAPDGADTFYDSLKNDRAEIILWAEREIEEYKHLISLLKKDISKIKAKHV